MNHAAERLCAGRRPKLHTNHFVTGGHGNLCNQRPSIPRIQRNKRYGIPHSVTRCFRGPGVKNWGFVGLWWEKDVLGYPPVGVQGKNRKNFTGRKGGELEGQRRYKDVPAGGVVLGKKRLRSCRILTPRRIQISDHSVEEGAIGLRKTWFWSHSGVPRWWQSGLERGGSKHTNVKFAEEREEIFDSFIFLYFR